MANEIKNFLTPELEEKLRAKDYSGKGMFPPPASLMIQSELVEYVDGASMTVRFPILSKYDNPFYITFGGLYGMFFDSVFGPLSGLESDGPTSSLDMNITFIKAVSVADEYVDVKAIITSKSKSFIILNGEARNKKGKLVATCTSRMIILDPMRMSKFK